MFSNVFPNTELFINLKKSFSKSVVPFVVKEIRWILYAVNFRKFQPEI